MFEPSTFHDLIRRVRAGDQDAAAELVRQYEPAIRRAVHFRLVDAGLRRLLDSTDICQAVFLSFFVRTASDQYELETPEQLQQLLVKMARNKLVNLAQQQHAERRDDRRLARRSIEQMSVVAPASSASELLAAKELLQETRRRLSGAARQVLELRESRERSKARAGQGWRGNKQPWGAFAEHRWLLTARIHKVESGLASIGEQLRRKHSVVKVQEPGVSLHS